ncbi:MAG: hypothetical protein IJM15_03680 [Erysipelotrichaceae bacterium]|nr:hypothetical protein [Erysipelotrichaceae bacterium]
MYYLIESTLVECSAEECHQGKKPYVAILTPEQWQKQRDSFDMGIDLDPDTLEIHTTEAEVNYDSVTGTFMIPVSETSFEDFSRFAFALDEKGIVFIDKGVSTVAIVNKIMETRKWRKPSLARFIYDFLELIIDGDLSLLEKYEKQLDSIDKGINEDENTSLDDVKNIRGYLRVLRTHYDRLIDLSQEFVENENNFFEQDDIRFFDLFSKRVGRLYEMVNSLLDYTKQIMEDYNSKQSDKQNYIMTILTIVTTVFSPLTLITGWYGMNFKYMPELNWEYAYPLVILVSILIAIACLVFFKFKKWL